jgi:hypothetical protein
MADRRFRGEAEAHGPRASTASGRRPIADVRRCRSWTNYVAHRIAAPISPLPRVRKAETSVRDAEPATSTHQQLAGHLAPRRHDLILAEAGLHQVGDEQLEAVSWTRVAGLAEVGR